MMSEKTENTMLVIMTPQQVEKLIEERIRRYRPLLPR